MSCTAHQPSALVMHVLHVHILAMRRIARLECSAEIKPLHDKPSASLDLPPSSQLLSFAHRARDRRTSLLLLSSPHA